MSDPPPESNAKNEGDTHPPEKPPDEYHISVTLPRELAEAASEHFGGGKAGDVIERAVCWAVRNAPVDTQKKNDLD